MYTFKVITHSKSSNKKGNKELGQKKLSIPQKHPFYLLGILFTRSIGNDDGITIKP